MRSVNSLRIVQEEEYPLPVMFSLHICMCRFCSCVNAHMYCDRTISSAELVDLIRRMLLLSMIEDTNEVTSWLLIEVNATICLP